MKITKAFNEITAFAFASVLSCGPSQLIGSIRLILDLGSLLATTIKRHHVRKATKLSHSAPLANQKIVALVAHKLKIKENDLTPEHLGAYLGAKNTKLEDKMRRLQRNLKVDCCAILPLVGAHLAWRIFSGYKTKSCTPIFSKATTYLLESFRKPCSKLFFLGRGGHKKASCRTKYPKFFETYNQFSIPVQTSSKSRSINAFFAPAALFSLQDSPFANPYKIYKNYREKEPIKSTEAQMKNAFENNPTVVLFHGGLGSAPDMTRAAEAYRQMGFNSLTVTIGGFPGSDGVVSSEKSTCQDVEAVKLFLKERGVKDVAWHGWCLGSGPAFEAATGEDLEGMNNLFVFVDTPFNSVKGMARNVAGPIGEGISEAGLPEGHLIELPGGKWKQTDGFNNLAKAGILKEKNIPLICVEATKDVLMGRQKQNGKYTENFAVDLLNKRYDNDSQAVDAFLFKQDYEHGLPFQEFEALYRLLHEKNLLPAATKEKLEEELKIKKSFCGKVEE